MTEAEGTVSLAVHGHFYQPPRENPWTEEVPREPTAAPFHDWNERIALEAYRPNAYARIVDDHGRVVQIVNNYEHLSFDVGPTLTAWLATHEPDTMQRIVDADRSRQGGVAQAYFHVILPLATPRDVRTLVRWGLAEFEHRFGRRADGIWLPETAVCDAVLRVLAEEGVGFTILASYQADRPIDPRRAYRWQDPDHTDDPTKGVDLVFYDGGLSHAIAFELANLSSERFVDRVTEAAPDGGLVAVAADGETFGHHHPYGDRFLAYALVAEAPKRHVEVTNVSEWLRDESHRPTETVGVVTSAWSCAHGVGRWMEDCGCATGGQPGWDQHWRAPLRKALDVVRDAVDEVYARRGPVVFGDAEAARDEYVHVLLGKVDRESFADRHVVGRDDKDQVEAFTLLEAARHALAMYTSCGWFFNDLAGLETVQVLRYAARAIDLLEELGESGEQGELLDRFLHELGEAESNVAAEGTGRDVWHRHVETARVTDERAVAHLALMELLEGRDPAATVGAFDVEVLDHGHADRGAVAMCSGKVRLTHRRTGRRTAHVYAAVRLGGLEVVGASRPAADDRDDHDGDDARADREALDRFRSAFEFDAPVTTLVRLVSEGFGVHEFGAGSGLPDAAGQLLHSAARRLSDRFSATYEQLYNDHRSTLTALTAAGYQLPAELRAPAELALTRRLEAEVAARGGSLDPADYVTAISIARDARANGVSLDTARARATMERLLVAAVRRAVEQSDAPDATADAAFAALDICEELEIHPSLDQAQEIVYEAVHHTHDTGDGDAPAMLRRLAARLGIAP